MRSTQYQLVVLQTRRDLLRLEDVASGVGVHPDIIRRFIDFGLIQPAETRTGGIMLEPDSLRRISIIQRLRCDLGINLAGIGVILELLDRLSTVQYGGPHGHQ